MRILGEARKPDGLSREVFATVQHGPKIDYLISARADAEVPHRALLRIVRDRQAAHADGTVQEDLFDDSLTLCVVI